MSLLGGTSNTNTGADASLNCKSSQEIVENLQKRLEQTQCIYLHTTQSTESEQHNLLMDIRKQIEELDSIISAAQKIKSDLKAIQDQYINNHNSSPGSPEQRDVAAELQSAEFNNQHDFRSKKYNVRSGTKDSGREYEYKMAALLSLRCLPDAVEDMWIAMNVDQVGSFDDIVLTIKQSDNATTSYLLQLKHKEKPRNVTKAEFRSPKGDFSIAKYSNDVSKLKQCFDVDKSEIIQSLGSFTNVNFVIFTNRGVDNCNFLVRSDGEMWEILNTSLNDNAVHSVDCSKLSLTGVHVSPNIYLLSNQMSVKHLDKLIAEEMMKLSQCYGITKCNFKNITETYVKYISDWSVGKLGGHYSLTKRDVLRKLTEIFLCQYEVKLDGEYFSFYNSSQKLIWNEVVAEKTVTVVDAKESESFRFLKDYIGSEVRKYYNNSEEVMSWTDRLSSQAQNLFYEHNENLKEGMLKTVGNSGRISLVDIYKCLWKTRKVPLLLDVDKGEDYENILQILKLSSYSSKVIIINKSLGLSSIKDTEVKPFVSFADVSDNLKAKILNNTIMLQSRPPAYLKKFLTPDMFEHIATSDIIHILANSFNIGRKLNSLPPYYIERSFAMIFIKVQALAELSDDLFLLENYYEGYLDNIEPNCTIVNIKKNEQLAEEIEKLKVTGQPLHWLCINEDGVEWKWTYGSTESIEPFMYMQGKFKSDISDYYNNSINIISEAPGMGKSTLLDYVALNAPTDKWILKIDFNAHNKYYRNDNCKSSHTDASKHLMYFNGFQDDTKLAQMVFRKLLDSRDVIILFDGFDEVSVSYKNEVRNIVRSIHKAGYPIWLTTRPIMQEYLEEQFSTKSLVLRTFTPTEQQRFLTSYFTMNNLDLAEESEVTLRRFVEDFLKAAKHNLNDRDANFTEVPLQIKLLADVFNEDCRKYLTSKGVVSFKSNFDLLYLYQHFIDRKMDILCSKFGAGTTDIDKRLKNHQRLLSLKLLFQIDNYVDTYSTRILQNYSTYYKEQMDEIHLLQKYGIIMVDEYFNISCVHRTYAEYLAAQWLTDNLHNEEEEETVQFLFKTRYTSYAWETFFFSVFDRMVAKNCRLHLFIINGQVEEAKRIINSDPHSVEEVDKCGRSFLHMIALYGTQFPTTYETLFCRNATFANDVLLDILKMVPNHVVFNTKPDIMMYTPLDYAIANRSFTIAHYLCSRSSVLVINSYFNLIFKMHCLKYCIALGYSQLIEILLPYFASRELLLKNIDEKVTLSTYAKRLNVLNIYNQEVIEQKTVLEVLQSDVRFPYLRHDGSYYTDVRYAIAFGSSQNVQILLNKGTHINKYDIDTYTPLHYAIMHGKPKIVELLLSHGASANKLCGYNNDTPLHLTVMENNKNSCYKSILDRRFINIAFALLSKAADANIQNLSGETPLHLVLQASEFEMNDYETDAQRMSLLRMKQLNMVKLLLSNENPCKCNPSKQNSSGRTPLHLASTDVIAKLLIYSGADVNLEDHLGKTPLRSAAAASSADTVVELLSHGADVNKPDVFGLTPLHSAKTEEVAALLTLYGADVNVTDNVGRTALHHAVLAQLTGIVHILLDSGCDINKEDHYGITPLNLANSREMADV